MIFTPEHYAMNAAETKTQTRRIQKEGDYAVWDPAGEKIIAVFRASGRIKYKVGKTYANQPGRGKKGNGRIRLLAIREEKLQDISGADMTAEGYPLLARFLMSLELWCQKESFNTAWDELHPRKDRWANNPPVWVETYEFVQGSEAASASTEAA